jgi:hypothetical protein
MDLKANLSCIRQAKTPLVDCFLSILPQLSGLAHERILAPFVVWVAQVWKVGAAACLPAQGHGHRDRDRPAQQRGRLNLNPAVAAR